MSALELIFTALSVFSFLFLVAYSALAIIKAVE